MKSFTLYENSPLRMDFCPETQTFSVWLSDKMLIETDKAELADAYFTKPESGREAADLAESKSLAN